MEKKYRVKKYAEFDQIFKTGKKFSTPHFKIVFRQTEEPHSRFGISIGKKFGNAVQRNKIKRQIRNILRNYKQCKLSFLTIVVVKPVAATLTFIEIKKELSSSLNKIYKVEEQWIKSKPCFCFLFQQF